MKKIISTDDAPSAIGTYSQGVLVNDFLYVSGQIALDPKNMKMVEGIAVSYTHLTLPTIALV